MNYRVEVKGKDDFTLTYVEYEAFNENDAVQFAINDGYQVLSIERHPYGYQKENGR